MMYLTGAGLIVLLAVVIVALGYRGKAKAEQHHAEMQQRRADTAESINNNRQQLDNELATLHETHREETINANDPTHLADRSDFNNNWSSDDGLRDSATADYHTASAAAADTTGPTVHFTNRPDLR
jgi:hypothetical protein